MKPLFGLILIFANIYWPGQAHEKEKTAPIKPLLIGNWADPSLVKLHDTYYLTANNADYVPSIMVFKSTDLLNWSPVGYTSPNADQGLATELTAYNDTLYIFGGGGSQMWNQQSAYPYQKWTERRVFSHLDGLGIDPGHITDEANNRVLFLNEGNLVRLSANAGKLVSEPEKVYAGWPFPENLAVECSCLESPKLFKHNGYYYSVWAQGGTAGPATSHMAVVARAKKLEGPWENSPHNPLIQTLGEDELWWSKGHATIFEGPDGNWFVIYHGYKQHHRELGRCTLLSPIEWTKQGWPILAKAWPKGFQEDIKVNFPLSDEFETDNLNLQWQSFGKFEAQRYHIENGLLELSGLGDDFGKSNPLTINPNSTDYEIEASFEVDQSTTAGIIFYYSPLAYVSLSLSPQGNLFAYSGKSSSEAYQWSGNNVKYFGKTVTVKGICKDHNVTFFYKSEQDKWTKIQQSFEISGFQHNIFGGFSSVRPGLFAIGTGKAKFDYFRYKVLTN
jgi:xylan 1,4-beta-xylosidase